MEVLALKIAIVKADGVKIGNVKLLEVMVRVVATIKCVNISVMHQPVQNTDGEVKVLANIAMFLENVKPDLITEHVGKASVLTGQDTLMRLVPFVQIVKIIIVVLVKEHSVVVVCVKLRKNGVLDIGALIWTTLLT